MNQIFIRTLNVVLFRVNQLLRLNAMGTTDQNNLITRNQQSFIQVELLHLNWIVRQFKHNNVLRLHLKSTLQIYYPSSVHKRLAFNLIVEVGPDKFFTIFNVLVINNGLSLQAFKLILPNCFEIETRLKRVYSFRLL